MQQSGPFYLAVIESPLSAVWYKRSCLGINSLNNMMQKSDIIGITGHSTEAGLDPYDSGDETQQKEYSFAIDGHEPTTSTSTSSDKVPAIMRYQPRTFDKTSLPSKRFDFFSDEFYDKLTTNNSSQHQPVMHFNNCTVYFGGETSKNI